ncbi:sodium pump decarboxylase gamma subunit [Colidextribacter sp. OB.20]|nr:sodium pump decarboxylase gamma subunit [Colidextribacter sp. OB.20]NBI09830.1 sodium pump decarboxylase gamma subunit [Colidextribacter sp. OB.20]
MSADLIQALEMLGQGMLGIFVVLGVIALFVILMQKLGGGK